MFITEQNNTKGGSMAETKSAKQQTAVANADEGTHKLETPWSLYIGKKTAKVTILTDMT
jgi:hypothetical protein